MPTANSDEKNELVKQFGVLRGDRGTFEEHWRSAAEIASPRDNFFNQEFIAQGQKVRDRQYDELAEQALDKSASFFGSVTTPQDEKWHTLQTTNIELNKIQAVREFLDFVNEIIFKWRYAPSANYSAAKYESDRSLIGFGTGIWFTGAGTGDPRFRVPLWYRNIHLSQCYLSENNRGLVDTLYNRVRMTGSQIIKEYGEENISKETLDMFKAQPETRHVVIHATLPNEDWSKEPDEINPNRFRFMSRHWLEAQDEDLYLRKGGFRTYPYSVPRDSRRPTEHYGRGTLMKVLPAIRMRNQMKRTHIRVAHQFSDPSLLVKDDSSIDIRDLRPGRKVVGGLDATGNPNILPFQSGAQYDISLDYLEEQKQVILDAFNLNLFLDEFSLEGRDRVTATEIRSRERDRARIMTPLASRSETEGLRPQIEREIDILTELDLLPELPDELKEAGGEYEIIFVDPLSVSRRSDEAIGSVQTVETIIDAATAQPALLDTINWDEYTGIVADANSSPRKLLNSREEIEEIRAARAEQEALQQAAQAAPGVGRGIKDIASAEQIAQGETAGV